MDTKGSRQHADAEELDSVQLEVRFDGNGLHQHDTVRDWTRLSSQRLRRRR